MSAFGRLAEFRTRPIGDLAEARARREGYRRHPIARSNLHFGEPLVDVRTFGLAGENFYWTERNPPYWRRIDGAIPSLLVRRGIGEKLAYANARLAAANLELFLFAASRPFAVQVYFHDVWMAREL